MAATVKDSDCGLRLCGCLLNCFNHVQLCSAIDCSPPGSSLHGILLARMLEWVAMPSSRRSSWPRDWTGVSYVCCIDRQVLYHWHHLGSPRLRLLLLSHFNHARLCVTPQIAAHQASLSLGVSRQEHWSGLPFPSPQVKTTLAQILVCHKLLSTWFFPLSVPNLPVKRASK